VFDRPLKDGKRFRLNWRIRVNNLIYAPSQVWVKDGEVHLVYVGLGVPDPGPDIVRYLPIKPDIVALVSPEYAERFLSFPIT
jgi:hypothetical protein